MRRNGNSITWRRYSPNAKYVDRIVARSTREAMAKAGLRSHGAFRRHYIELREKTTPTLY